jgi:redox-sensitive bicupin YhaK (pirin superfamily)
MLQSSNGFLAPPQWIGACPLGRQPKLSLPICFTGRGPSFHQIQNNVLNGIAGIRLRRRKMIIVRKSEERRHIGDKVKNTWRTFDWENNSDSLQNGFGGLKIFNEEILTPGTGFILQTNENMVIVTYIKEGLIIYDGPLETSGLLESGEIHQINLTSITKQYGFDTLLTDDAHVFQSGFIPSLVVSKPGNRKKYFTHAERKGILRLIASPDGKKDSLKIPQDVHMYSTLINKGNHVIHELGPSRAAWLHMVNGEILTNDLKLQTGDGAGFSEERSVSFTAQMPTEILLFDLSEPVVQKAEMEPQKKRSFPGINFFRSIFKNP